MSLRERARSAAIQQRWEQRARSSENRALQHYLDHAPKARESMCNLLRQKFRVEVPLSAIWFKNCNATVPYARVEGMTFKRNDGGHLYVLMSDGRWEWADDLASLGSLLGGKR